MNLEKHDLSRAVSAIRSGDFAQNTLDFLYKITIQNCASLLVAELIRCEKTDGKTEDDAVSQVMLLLETLGNTSPPIACILMAHLWSSAAGDLFLHDECDRIDLWISHCDSPDLLSQIKLLASSENDADLRRHFEQWVQSKT